MSRLAASAIMGVIGTGAVALVGAHYLGAFSGSEETHAPTPSTPVHVYNKSLQELKKKDGKSCFSNLFNNGSTNWEIDNMSDNDQLVEIKAKGDVKLGGSPNDLTVGCFEYGINVSDKGEGSSFGFVWTVIRGNKALAVYLATSGKEMKTLQFNGVFYVFEKKDGNKGSPMQKMNIREESKEMKVGDIGEKFPKKGTNFISSSLNNYWNFLNKEGNDINRETTKSKNSSGKGYMFVKPEKDSDCNAEVTSGTSNLDAWGKHFFGDELVKISEVIGSTKGKWTT